MFGTVCCKSTITLLVIVFIMESKQMRPTRMNMADLTHFGCRSDLENTLQKECVHGWYWLDDSPCPLVKMCYQGLNESCNEDTGEANKLRCKPNLSCNSCKVCQNCDGNKCNSTLCPMSMEKKRWMRIRIPLRSQVDTRRPPLLDYKPIVPNSWDYQPGSDEMYPQ